MRDSTLDPTLAKDGTRALRSRRLVLARDQCGRHQTDQFSWSVSRALSTLLSGFFLMSSEIRTCVDEEGSAHVGSPQLGEKLISGAVVIAIWFLSAHVGDDRIERVELQKLDGLPGGQDQRHRDSELLERVDDKRVVLGVVVDPENGGPFDMSGRLVIGNRFVQHLAGLVGRNPPASDARLCGSRGYQLGSGINPPAKGNPRKRESCFPATAAFDALAYALRDRLDERPQRSSEPHDQDKNDHRPGEGGYERESARDNHRKRGIRHLQYSNASGRLASRSSSLP